MAQFLFIQAELQGEDAAIGMPATASGLLPAADREQKGALGLADGVAPRQSGSALRRFARHASCPPRLAV